MSLTLPPGTLGRVTRPEFLSPFLAEPDRSGLLVDFDGSLAPIIDDPEQARPLEGVTDVLAALVDRFGVVAVVSGRPITFLQQALPVPGLHLAGVYGMERLVDGQIEIDAGVAPWVDVLAEAAAEVRAAMPDLLIERKGDVSFVLHWRTAPEWEEKALDAGRAIAERLGLAAERGRRALEIRPPVPVDKGVAAEAILAPVDHALFAGDDLGDLRAFDALDVLLSDGRLRTAVKIAVTSPEAPAELLARADERVDGPPGLLHLLRSLAG